MSLLDSPQQRARILILALGLGLLYAISPYLSGLMGAAVLFVVCRPVHDRLVRYGVRPRWSASLVVLAITLAIVLPLVWIGTVAAGEAPGVFESVRQHALLDRLSTLRIGTFDIGSRLAEFSGTAISWASGQAVAVFGGAARIVVNFALALFGLFFLLLSGTELWTVLRGLIPFSDDHTDALRLQFHRVTESMLLGTVLTASLQGLLVGIGFALTGLPGASFWGLATALASILPLFGSALVWIPGVAVHMMDGSYGAAVSLALIGALLGSNVDNVVRPLVYQRFSNLHPMTTLLGAFAGVSTFGLLGLLLGPLLISYFFALLRIYAEEYGEGEVRTGAT